MEVMFIQFYSRQIFTTVKKQLLIDEDGLSKQQRNMLFVHKFMIPPEGIICDVQHDASCSSWHSNCILQVPTIKKAFEIWNIIQKSDSNACTRMTGTKGILIQ
jgi:hypothetical protein